MAGWGVYATAKDLAENRQPGLLGIQGFAGVMSVKLFWIVLSSAIWFAGDARWANLDFPMKIGLLTLLAVSTGLIAICMWGVVVLFRDLSHFERGAADDIRARTAIGMGLFIAAVGAMGVLGFDAGKALATPATAFPFGILFGLLLAVAARMSWMWRWGR